MRKPIRHRGVTLVEAMIACTVLGIAVIGVAGLMASSAGQAEFVKENSTAMLLARQLMEEIAAKPLLDNGGTTRHLGPENSENSRINYDSADDYHGYYDDTSGSIKTVGNEWITLGGGLRFTRRVTVEYRATPAGAANSNGDFALVTVTVTPAGGNGVVLTRMMCNVTMQH